MPWIDDFVRGELGAASVDNWVERILGSIFESVPEVRNDAALSETVRVATAAHWRSFLTHLGQPEQEFRLIPHAAEVVKAVAERGHPLHVILGIYSNAQREVWHYIIDVVDRLPPTEFDDKEVLVHFWTRASAWFDGSVESSLQLYNSEVDRIRQGGAARQLDAVRAILNGEVSEAKVASASLDGHPLSSVNTAILLNTNDDNVIADLRSAAKTLTSQLGLRRSLVIHPGGRDLWCWTSSRSEPDLSRLHESEGWLAERRITAAVGAPAPGLVGFRTTHRDALAAQRLALSSIENCALTLFTEVEVLTLVAGAEGMPDFVARTLGQLAEPGEASERLRETVGALLVHHNVEAAARALSVHKNTVRYRVDRAEEILGRPVTERSTELDLALRWFARFPPEAAAKPRQGGDR